MRPLCLNDGAVNVAGAKLGAPLQQVCNLPQERIAPLDDDRLSSSNNRVKLGISQTNGRRHGMSTFDKPVKFAGRLAPDASTDASTRGRGHAELGRKAQHIGRSTRRDLNQRATPSVPFSHVDQETAALGLLHRQLAQPLFRLPPALISDAVSRERHDVENAQQPKCVKRWCYPLPFFPGMSPQEYWRIGHLWQPFGFKLSAN
jgi:hypothetical protein